MMKNSNFLIIDSSSSTLKIGLKLSEQKVSIDYRDDFKHLENILPIISQLLSKIDAKINDISNILVCNGPGSFTGIRIGLATSYGLYSSLDNVNCYGFNVFDVYKFFINERDSLIIPVIDAKKNRFYCSFIEKDNEYQYFDLAVEEIIEKIFNINKKIVFTGEDFKLIKDKFNMPYTYLYENDFSSDDLIKFGEYFLNSEIKKEFPEPLYIRKSEAEISLLHKKGVL